MSQRLDFGARSIPKWMRKGDRECFCCVFFSGRPQESDDDDDDDDDDDEDMSLMQPKTGANKSWKESNKTERKYEKEK